MSMFLRPQNSQKSCNPRILLTDGKGALDLTLKSSLRNPDATTGWIYYNDEMPRVTNGTDSQQLRPYQRRHRLRWRNRRPPSGCSIPGPEYRRPAGENNRSTPDVRPNLPVHLPGFGHCGQNRRPKWPTTRNRRFFFPRVPGALDKKDPLYALTQPLKPNAPGDCGSPAISNHAAGWPFKVIAKNRKWNKDF